MARSAPRSSGVCGELTAVQEGSDFSRVYKWIVPNLKKSDCMRSRSFKFSSALDSRLVVYPVGMSSNGSPSLFLEVIHTTIDRKENNLAYFKLCLVNSKESKSVIKECLCRFTSKNCSQGRNNFAPPFSLSDPELGFIENDSFTIIVDVRVLDESWSPTKIDSGLSGGKHTWNIRNFRLFSEVMNQHRLMSPSFETGDCEFRIVVYRSGEGYLSMCLESTLTNTSNKNVYVNCWIMFKLSIINKLSANENKHFNFYGRFGGTETFGDSTQLGESKCIKFSEFMEAEGFLVQDTAEFVVLFQVIDESFSSSPRDRTPYSDERLWEIKRFSCLKDILKKRKITGLAVKSVRFDVAEQGFRLVIYPRGRSLENHQQVSFFLGVGEKLNIGESYFVSFQLSIIKTKGPKTEEKCLSKELVGRYGTTDELGWTDFLSLGTLSDRYVSGDGSVVLRAKVLLLKEIILNSNAELEKEGLSVDSDCENFFWKLENYLRFCDGSIDGKQNDIWSPYFLVNGEKIRIVVSPIVGDTVGVKLLREPPVNNGDAVEYKLTIINKNFPRSMWKTYCFEKDDLTTVTRQFKGDSNWLHRANGFLDGESIALLLTAEVYGSLTDSSTDSSTELGVSSTIASLEPVFLQINQFTNMQKEMQKQMITMVTAQHNESIRLEIAVGKSMEKSIEAHNDALWALLQEENAKQEKLVRELTQQITSVITNFINKDLPALVEKAVKNEFSTFGRNVAHTISPAIEKAVSVAIPEAFQKGVGDMAVNQLEKSVNLKIEATVARQIQAQFQTSGKQALQDAINSASSLTQTLSGELADGQRKLLALAAAGANSKAVNPLVTQLSNGPLGALHDKIEAPLDPTKELSRLVSERKYEVAFTAALEGSDVSIVSWLCSQVDLQQLLEMVPLPLSQGVLLSLLQQLACDISKNTTRKLVWMTEVAIALNPTDPMIAVHVQPILEQVYQMLNHHRSLPTASSSELSIIRLLMHVINSMVMSQFISSSRSSLGFLDHREKI